MEAIQAVDPSFDPGLPDLRSYGSDMTREDVREPIVGEALRLVGQIDQGVKPLLQDRYS